MANRLQWITMEPSSEVLPESVASREVNEDSPLSWRKKLEDPWESLWHDVGGEA